MILADKIIDLRKKNGWSQEEMADRLGVSRQAVSKWEGAQSIPDLERVLAMSRLFGVSTDYLLKDELEAADSTIPEEPATGLHRVSMEEAGDYLELKQRAAGRIALVCGLCILLPLPILVGGVLLQQKHTFSGLAAMTVMLLIPLILTLTAAVVVLHRMLLKTYHYLDKEPIETAYGVEGMVRERMRSYRSAFVRDHVIGIVLIGMCYAPYLILYEFVRMEMLSMDVVMLLSSAIALLMLGAGVFLIIRSRMINGSFQRLLQEGRYTVVRKAAAASPWVAVYWCVVIAAFLGYTLLTGAVGHGLIFLLVMGVLFGALLALLRAGRENRSADRDSKYII
ncbi:MAG: helix-turn-helix domain-containing protein [Clostridia bacterium]|nr:helix-turn-helix domain-containing protein [Clostridia bacterium]